MWRSQIDDCGKDEHFGSIASRYKMRGLVNFKKEVFNSTHICRASGSGRGGSGGQARNTYGDSRRQHWQMQIRDEPSRFDRSSGRPAVRREEDEEDLHGDEDEDRPPTIRDQRLGEVLYGVFPVLNALRAKR